VEGVGVDRAGDARPAGGRVLYVWLRCRRRKKVAGCAVR
jgi:hypothetical protein